MDRDDASGRGVRPHRGLPRTLLRPSKPPGSGVDTRIPTAAIAEYRDGLLWRYKDYGESRLALEAAGLRE